jgi:hypothetical protein
MNTEAVALTEGFLDVEIGVIDEFMESPDLPGLGRSNGKFVFSKVTDQCPKL